MKFFRKKYIFLKRIKLLSDRFSKYRIRINMSLKRSYGLLIFFNGKLDQIVFSSISSILERFNWPFRKNIMTSYLHGFLFGKFLLKKKLTEKIGFKIDLGIYKLKKNSNLAFFIEGLRFSKIPLRISKNFFIDMDLLKSRSYSPHLDLFNVILKNLQKI